MERTRNIPALLALSVFAAVVPVVGESLAEDAFAAPSIARMARLPVGGLQAVETTDGDLLFLSDNGRYVFRGAAVDLWHGTKLTEFEVVQRLAGRIDLDVGELGAIDLGPVGAKLQFEAI